MIADICLTADWLERKRRELKGVDPALLERALHAFALLGHLAESELEFVIKGGTSLLPAGCLAQVLLSEATPGSLRERQALPRSENLRLLEIPGDWHSFNRLKATNPEAFWYWYQASGVSP